MYQVGILSCWVSEEARVSRILSLPGTLRIRVDLLHISSATHGGILIMYRRYNYQIIAQL